MQTQNLLRRARGNVDGGALGATIVVAGRDGIGAATDFGPLVPIFLDDPKVSASLINSSTQASWRIYASQLDVVLIPSEFTDP